MKNTNSLSTEIALCHKCGTTSNLHIYQKKKLKFSCRDCARKKIQEYRKTRSGNKKIREAWYRYYNNPDNQIKILAKSKVKYALKVGKLVKPDRCPVCKKKTIVQGHHHDYSKPLDVKWRCPPCHKKEHAT